VRFVGIDRSKDGSGVCFDTSLADGRDGTGVRNTLWCYAYGVQPRIYFVDKEEFKWIHRPALTMADARRRKGAKRVVTWSIA